MVKFRFSNGVTVELIKGDITEVETDAQQTSTLSMGVVWLGP